MEIFKVVLDEIELSEAESKHLSATMEKATLDLLAKRPKSIPVASIDPKRLLEKLPEGIRGKILYPEGLSEKAVAAVAKREFAG